MNDLYRTCVALALVGIALIYGSSKYIEPEKVNVSEIKQGWTGKRVTVEGTAQEVEKSEGHLFMELNGSADSIEVADFDTEVKPEEGQKIQVKGRIDMYRGRLQIVAEEIKG